MRAKALGLCLGVLVACDSNHSATGGRDTQQALGKYPGPQFPGAGTSGSGNGLAAGDAALGCNAPLPFAGRPVNGTAAMSCFYGDGNTTPAATVEWVVESTPAANDLIHVRLTLNPDFCDNTYGANAIGWDGTGNTTGAKAPMGGKAPKDPMGMAKPGGKSGHTFKDLVGSDHAEFKLTSKSGALVLHFKADYITESASTTSGYGALGVTGGEGKMIVGNAGDVVAASSSMDRNLNVCGLGSYLVDSPATDASYTPNPLTPNWDYRVVYDIWVRSSAFGAAGFGAATVDFVHASPSKLGGNTVDVTPGECPPGWPPYCTNPEGCCLSVDGSCGTATGTPPNGTGTPGNTPDGGTPIRTTDGGNPPGTPPGGVLVCTQNNLCCLSLDGSCGGAIGTPPGLPDGGGTWICTDYNVCCISVDGSCSGVTGIAPPAKPNGCVGDGCVTVDI